MFRRSLPIVSKCLKKEKRQLIENLHQQETTTPLKKLLKPNKTSVEISNIPSSSLNAIQKTLPIQAVKNPTYRQKEHFLKSYTKLATLLNPFQPVQTKTDLQVPYQTLGPYLARNPLMSRRTASLATNTHTGQCWQERATW